MQNRGGLQKVRVVLLDDNAFQRAAVAVLLASDRTIEVIGQAADGLQGLELILSKNPDVVVTDLEMPIMNGADFIQEQLRRKAVPIVIYSGLDFFSPLAKRARSFARLAHVVKPMPGEDLPGRLQELRNAIHDAASRVRSDR
jgi:chemotaxis response regulator CheB